MQELKGLGVAMVTPFNSDGNIDYTGLEKLVNHLHTGADYLVVMGTTGEAATLEESEQLAILDFVTEVNASKLPIVYGMGGNNTGGLVKKLKQFDKKDVVAFLSASPYYSKPSQEGIFRHYKALDETSNLPIILYNVPGRTASNVLPATVKGIVENTDKIVGIKEAAGSIEQVMELARILPENFLLLSGDDLLVLPHMACGGDGVISVLGNAYPRKFGAVVKAAMEGDFSSAREQHLKFLPLINHLFAEGNPGGIKEVLKHLGICDNHMRLPLYPVSGNLGEELKKDMEQLG